MTNATKNITVTINFIYAHYMNHRMHITLERSEHDLMTNSVKRMQQMSSPLSEDDSNVCNYYLLQSNYLTT